MVQRDWIGHQADGRANGVISLMETNMKMSRFAGILMAGVSIAASWSAQAAIIDYNLKVVNASENIGGAQFTQGRQQPTGSGLIDSFVRIGFEGAAGQSIVQGYNTEVDDIYDNGMDNTFNHAVTVGQIGIFDTNGAAAGGEVMRFLLDINQTGNTANTNSFLNLDEVQIFISTSGNQAVEPTMNQGTLLNPASSFLVYQMDAGLLDNRVMLDADLGCGSGCGDMFLDIPLSMLNAAFTAGGATFDTLAERNGAFVYLYSRFGSDPNENNDGFEEWTAVVGADLTLPPCIPTPTRPCAEEEIPEPGSLALLGIGLFGAAASYRRRRKA